jgi:hypothetical protein
MRHHRMAGVGLVLDQHLPVALMHVAQRRPGNLEPPAGERSTMLSIEDSDSPKKSSNEMPVSARRQKMKPR